jgi:hypothetical protein
MNRKEIGSRNFRNGKICEEFCGIGQVISSLVSGYTDMNGNPKKIDDFIVEANTKN